MPELSNAVRMYRSKDSSYTLGWSLRHIVYNYSSTQTRHRHWRELRHLRVVDGTLWCPAYRYDFEPCYLASIDMPCASNIVVLQDRLPLQCRKIQFWFLADEERQATPNTIMSFVPKSSPTLVKAHWSKSRSSMLRSYLPTLASPG